MLRETLPALSHPNDGLVFVRLDSPYVSGTDRGSLKWKPSSHISVDFHVQALEALNGQVVPPDSSQISEYWLSVYVGSGKHRRFAKLDLSDPALHLMSASMMDGLNDTIIECIRNNNGSWVPKLDGSGKPMVRRDKNRANHMTVVEEIIKSIDDGIDELELISWQELILDAWRDGSG